MIAIQYPTLSSVNPSANSIRWPAIASLSCCQPTTKPCITETLLGLPDYVRHIIVVDDCSRDTTSDVVRKLAESDLRIQPIRHEQKRGVGGAMITGLTCARELRAQLVVKMDADGQMSPPICQRLLRPLISGQADFAKGNRFHDFLALASMPPLRRAGNMGLSFLTKAAVGYWNIADPCNGYAALGAKCCSGAAAACAAAELLLRDVTPGPIVSVRRGYSRCAHAGPLWAGAIETPHFARAAGVSAESSSAVCFAAWC